MTLNIIQLRQTTVAFSENSLALPTRKARKQAAAAARAAAKREKDCHPLLAIEDVIERILTYCEIGTLPNFLLTSRRIILPFCRIAGEKFWSPHLNPINQIFWNTLKPETIELKSQNGRVQELELHTRTKEEYHAALRTVRTPFLSQVFTSEQKEILEQICDIYTYSDQGLHSDLLSHSYLKLLCAIPDEWTLESIVPHLKITQLSSEDILAVLMTYFANITGLDCDSYHKAPSSLEKKITITVAELILNSPKCIETLDEEGKTAITGTLVALDKLEFLPAFEESISSFPELYNMFIRCFSLLGKLDRLKTLLEDTTRAARLSEEGFNEAISHASQNGHLAVVEFLLSNPTRATLLSEEGFNEAISRASQNGHLAIVEFLLSDLTRATMLSEYDFNKAISCASQNGHLAIVEFLLSDPTRATLLSEDGFNEAIYSALLNEHLAIVEFLFSDPTRAAMLSEAYFNNAIYFASQNGCLAIVEFLLSDPTRAAMLSEACFNNAIFSASQNGHLPLLRLLLLDPTSAAILSRTSGKGLYPAASDAINNQCSAALQLLLEEPSRAALLTKAHRLQLIKEIIDTNLDLNQTSWRQCIDLLLDIGPIDLLKLEDTDTISPASQKGIGLSLVLTRPKQNSILELFKRCLPSISF